MAAARAAVQTIAEEDLVEQARLLGADVLDRVRDALDPLGDVVTDIRGRGLLIGVEMRDEALAGELVLHLLESGLLVNHSLNAHKVVRLTPPAVLTRFDLDQISTAFAAAATAIAKGPTCLK